MHPLHDLHAYHASERAHRGDPDLGARVAVRPNVDRLLAMRGLTRGDLDRALAGDETSPAWPLIDRRYILSGERTGGELLAAEPTA
jgi:hypothetical protein